MYISDNATCFTGPELTNFVSQIGSIWQFILPASPWWGGFWERLVKTVKRCLRKILGKSKLNYEELLTVIVEIEGVLNSRPLCYVYDDPSDEIITPSHLMIGRRILSSCYSDVDPENVDFSVKAISKRSKYISSLLKNFWCRWTREYLTELREHHKCKEKLPSKQVVLEDVVLIEEGKVPRNQWKMGIVTDLVRSKDGIVRGCKLRTLSKGKKPSVLYRPVSKLYPLEISKRESTESSDNILSATSSISNPDLPEKENELPEKIEIAPAQTTRPRRKAATKGALRRVQNKHK